MKPSLYLTLISWILISSCSNRAHRDLPVPAGKMEYASYFTITGTRVKNLTVKNTWSGNTRDESYLLVPRDCTVLLTGNLSAIPYPIKTAVCMSTSHLAYLTALEELSCIKGISGARYVCHPGAQERISRGEIVDIGSETLPNYEQIIALKPDIVFAYGISGSNNSYIEKLQQFGIRVLTIGDYLESNPLGKMEYLKLFGELAGKRERADSLFRQNATLYNTLKNTIAQEIRTSPRVKILINAPYKGIWYVPGGENYISRLVEDAGGEILGATPGEIQTAQLSFENVYNMALQAGIWLHPNAINTLAELEKENPLFKNIPALKAGQVYNNNLRSTPEGGSDFWETGVVEPHLILKDLAKILHPDLFADSTGLKYYRQLR